MTSELRIKIAESLGWKITVLREGELTQTWHVHPNGVSWFREPPAYDEDANAALQLVEVLAKEGYGVQMWRRDNQCNVTIYSEGSYKGHYAEGSTLPEAICLAYCAVRGIAEKGKEA